MRWQTFGLDRTLEPAALEDRWSRYHRRRHRGRVTRSHGLVVLTPSTPDEARAWALSAMGLEASGPYGTDYTCLGPSDRGYDGEIQIFRRFRPMVSVAGRARAQVLSRQEGPVDPDLLRPAIWQEAEIVRGETHLRVRVWRDRGYEPGCAAAAMLAHADVATLDDLAAIGPVEAYRRMRAAGVPGLDLEMLWAMEGALTYRDRRGVGPERRRELRSQLGAEPVVTGAARTTRPRRGPTRRGFRSAPGGR
ncbi:TfoX/Sxy family DNA transformation protein [Nocardia sp. NPDC004582]